MKKLLSILVIAAMLLQVMTNGIYADTIDSDFEDLNFGSMPQDNPKAMYNMPPFPQGQNRQAFDSETSYLASLLEDGRFTAKPLVVLVDFDDYHYDQFLEKETRPLYISPDGYEASHYENMFFADETYAGPNKADGSSGEQFYSMNKFYKLESRGRYEIKGGVYQTWIRAKKPAAYYGENDEYNSDMQSRSYELVVEALESIGKDQKFDLSDYDIEDRYDYDKDGDLAEPDGIVDTIIVVHAGRGEEWWSGGSLGKTAIWPYRGKVSYYNETKAPYRITDVHGKKISAEDFIMVEQDTPLGLVAHEYGHNLGLPDLYGNSEPVSNWTTMAGGYNGVVIGSMPTGLGAYCKEELQETVGGNWQQKKTIDLEDIPANGIDIKINASSSQNLQASDSDAIRINLPEKEVTMATPTNGDNLYWSGKNNYLKNTMTLSNPVDLTAVSAAFLKFKTTYDIEENYDYGYVQVTEDLNPGEDTVWTSLEGNITKKVKGDIYAVTGTSGKDEWVDAAFDLSRYAGKKINLRFLYETDTNTFLDGWFMDEIEITGNDQVILSDDAEGDSIFIQNGFTESDGIQRGAHYYLLEWRNWQGVDAGLQHNHYRSAQTPYDQGLLVWYVDRTLGSRDRLNQDAEAHPGSVSVGIVDADQKVLVYKDLATNIDYKEKDNTYNMRDAAFSLTKGTPFEIDWLKNGITSGETRDRNLDMHPVFSDRKDYSNPDFPPCGLLLDRLGLNIFITEQSGDNRYAMLHIVNANNAASVQQNTSDIRVEGISVENDQVTVKASGNLGEQAYIGYISADGTKEQVVDLIKQNDNFVGSLTGSLSGGSWKVNYVIIKDTAGSLKAIYNSEMNSGFGADLSGGSMNKISVRFIDAPASFNLGGDAKVTVELTNDTKLASDGMLIIALFDKTSGKMLNYTSVAKKLAVDEVQRLDAAFSIPASGTYEVKAFVWDNWTNKRPLSNALTIPIQ